MQKEEFIGRCNEWAVGNVPFLFVINYEMDDFRIMKLEEAAEQGYYYAIHGNSNHFPETGSIKPEFSFDIIPVSYEKYKGAFEYVRKNIFHGNSFLLNLTFPTLLRTELKLLEVFEHSRAPYRLYVEDDFVVFSPESFIRISEGNIYSYPMKGTIDANIPGAAEIILHNEKETWEHNTIVDLIRNDLSMVSKDVTVNRFRYIDHVKTIRKDLLQVSSEIMGKLPGNWREKLGEIMLTLLPAGSICGAPKKKTVEIIAEAEGEKRGFFTGIFGVFDGVGLDSAVMIRFIEKDGERLRFRSGGGITGHSKAEDEYNEMIDKVYVPII